MPGEKQDQIWPLPKFHFSVEVDGFPKSLGFKEVSGLDAEVSLIEYRHGNSKEFSKIKMPGMKKYSDITLKKAVFDKDNHFFDWFNQIQMNTIERKTIVIKLLDEQGNPTMIWELNNAFPMKITGTSLDSEDDGAPAIEELTLAHEGLTVKNS